MIIVNRNFNERYLNRWIELLLDSNNYNVSTTQYIDLSINTNTEVDLTAEYFVATETVLDILDRINDSFRDRTLTSSTDEYVLPFLDGQTILDVPVPMAFIFTLLSSKKSKRMGVLKKLLEVDIITQEEYDICDTYFIPLDNFNPSNIVKSIDGDEYIIKNDKVTKIEYRIPETTEQLYLISIPFNSTNLSYDNVADDKRNFTTFNVKNKYLSPTIPSDVTYTDDALLGYDADKNELDRLSYGYTDVQHRPIIDSDNNYKVTIDYGTETQVQKTLLGTTEGDLNSYIDDSSIMDVFGDGSCKFALSGNTGIRPSIGTYNLIDSPTAELNTSKFGSSIDTKGHNSMYDLRDDVGLYDKEMSFSMWMNVPSNEYFNYSGNNSSDLYKQVLFSTYSNLSGSLYNHIIFKVEVPQYETDEQGYKIILGKSMTENLWETTELIPYGTSTHIAFNIKITDEENMYADFSVFINGVKVHEKLNEFFGGAIMNISPTTLFGFNSDTTGVNRFSGQSSHNRLFNRIMTEAEVITLFNEVNPNITQNQYSVIGYNGLVPETITESTNIVVPETLLQRKKYDKIEYIFTCSNTGPSILEIQSLGTIVLKNISTYRIIDEIGFQISDDIESYNTKNNIIANQLYSIFDNDNSTIRYSFNVDNINNKNVVTTTFDSTIIDKIDLNQVPNLVEGSISLNVHCYKGGVKTTVAEGITDFTQSIKVNEICDSIELEYIAADISTLVIPEDFTGNPFEVSIYEIDIYRVNNIPMSDHHQMTMYYTALSMGTVGSGSDLEFDWLAPIDYIDNFEFRYISPKVIQ